MNADEVLNQSKPWVGANVFEANQPLRDALANVAPALDTQRLSSLGALVGSAEMQEHARLANTHQPQLHTHDVQGRRIDQVEFHPSYHALLGAALRFGLHGTPWLGGALSHIERAAGFMLFTELEPSVLCPVSRLTLSRRRCALTPRLPRPGCPSSPPQPTTHASFPQVARAR
jgi:putative acyl-CoA dehydrogenase